MNYKGIKAVRDPWVKAMRKKIKEGIYSQKFIHYAHVWFQIIFWLITISALILIRTPYGLFLAQTSLVLIGAMFGLWIEFAGCPLTIMEKIAKNHEMKS